MWMKVYLAWHWFFVLWDVSKKKKKIKSVIYWIYFYEKINAVQWNLYLEIITFVDKIWYLSLETSQLNLTNGLFFLNLLFIGFTFMKKLMLCSEICI